MVTEAVCPGALHALSHPVDSGSDWRVLTAPFVQEGVVGGQFNLMAAIVVVALANSPGPSDHSAS